MTIAWGAPAARASGLAVHLLTDAQLRASERSETLTELLHALRGTAYERHLPVRAADPRAIEIGITRSAAERLAILARWAEPVALAPVLLHEDARSLRAVLRGALGALGPEQRLAGAIPTPLLGRKALERLASAESVGRVAATLVVWQHPLGPALLEAAGGAASADLLRLEVALARALASASSTAARRAGRSMVAFVAEDIDADNVTTALLLRGARREGELADYFVPGGARLGLEDFGRAAGSASPGECAAILRRSLGGGVLARSLEREPLTPTAVRARLLDGRLAELARRRRTEPLTAVPVLLFVLRLRREVEVVRRALWLTSMVTGAHA